MSATAPQRIAREVVSLWFREHPGLGGEAYTARRSLELAIAEAIRHERARLERPADDSTNMEGRG